MSVRTDQVNMNVTINGERAGSTLNDLRRKSRELKNELSKLPVESEAFRKKMAELNTVNKTLGGITKELRGLNSAWGDIKKTFAGFTLAEVTMQAAGAIKNFAKDSVKAYNEAAQAEAQLLNALNGQQDVQQRLIEQAKQLQKSTIYQDDAIVAAQTYLAAQQLTEEQILNTMQAAVQLAAVTGTDLQTATEQLAGTYEGVTGKMGKLDSAIKGFSKEQLANGAVIDLVNTKYKNFAETAAQTGAGPMTQLNNEFNDLQETVGKYLTPAITGIVQGFKWFFGLLQPMITAVDKLFDSLGMTGGGMWYFKTTIEVILSPLALLVKSVTWLVETFNKIIPVLSGVSAAFKQYFEGITEMAQNAFGGIGKMLQGAFTLDWNLIKQGFAQTQQAYAKAGSDIAEAYTKAYKAKLAQMNAGDSSNPATLAGMNLNNSQNVSPPEVVQKKQYDKLLATQKDYQQLLIDNMEEGADKERAILLAKYKRELEDYGLHFDNLQNLTAEEQLIVSELSVKYGKELRKIQEKHEIDRLAVKQRAADDSVKITKKEKSREQEVHLEFAEWYRINEEMVRDITYASLDVVASVADVWRLHYESIADNENYSREERIRAAKHLKAIKLAEAGIMLAATLLMDGLSGNWIKFAKDAALGAIQISTISATPIPKYARGRITDGPEIAQIGEDGVEAVIPLTPKYRAQAMPIFAEAASALGFNMAGQQPQAIAGSGAPSGNGATDKMLMKMLYKMERTIDNLNNSIGSGVPAYLDFDRFERDLKKVERLRAEG